jgi:hypothetical protein
MVNQLIITGTPLAHSHALYCAVALKPRSHVCLASLELGFFTILVSLVAICGLGSVRISAGCRSGCYVVSLVIGVGSLGRV